MSSDDPFVCLFRSIRGKSRKLANYRLKPTPGIAARFSASWWRARLSLRRWASATRGDSKFQVWRRRQAREGGVGWPELGQVATS
jgi:hypothetical protein